MIHIILITILLVIIVILLAMKIKKSIWFDNLCKFFTEEIEPDGSFSTKQVINEINKAKEDLEKKVDKNIKDVKKLQVESDKIDNFLRKKGEDNK